ncbi:MULTISPECIES: oligopeptide/dipeptide ABC transporter ATP-binding protein [Halolamina]|uniref:Peptide/nickel transport system ATP-binding protein n=1 Tax=Halolamina pelagica TaxID=699431 RepID=A0A1I5U0H8_9EURY|nr:MULTISPECIES: ABC transporter ATP-binding protein [Halolamina]NHX36735.1 ABC transporter ATP-binding protein [Halolamina sp. R1-12]SFP88820.1 peptide/nickel transport system ATP-binding protein [Halolamina pelagica]
MTVLELDDASKFFRTQTGLGALLSRDQEYVKAVNDVSLQLDDGEIVGLVGESGCGKTTLGKVVMRIHELTDGEITLHGTPIEEYGRKEYFQEVQMVFQDPFKSLNPQMTVREQLAEPLKVHGHDDREERIRESLEFANLTPPDQYLDRYPHEISGGEKQRVAIARALVLDPSVIIADEPVSMLDVSIRAGVLNLFRQLAEERDVTILYISHDLATVRHICTEIAVMYLGKVMEYGPTERICSTPSHPYTERLLSATPVADPTHDRSKVVYDEEVPDPVDLPDGCFFKHRCEFATEACDEEDMHLRPPAKAEADDEDWLMACHRAADGDLDWETIPSHNL